MVVIEDIHWSDEATLDLLRFLARRIREIPVLIVATYRADELATSYPLRLALGELAVQRNTRRVSLVPLSPGAVEIMAADSGLDAAQLYQATGGNPFYVTEVMQTGLDRVPPSARDAVLARAARLGPQASGVLYAAALIGATVQPQLLERAAATSPEMVDELAESGLLVADGATLRFRHEIARRAVEEAIPGHRRPAIHARILAALRDTGCEDHAQLAFHAEAAGERPAALRHATLAGRRAVELGSHCEAAAQFERALRFAGDEPAAALAARYDDLADELRMIDSLDGAADAYRRALELWREAGDQLREGDTLRRSSGALWRLCRGREASAAAADALRTLEPLGPSVELAQAYVTVAGYQATDTHFSEAIAAARRGREIAGQLGCYPVQSAALTIEALTAWSAGQGWEALISQALAVALDHHAAAEAGHAYTNRHELTCSSRRYAESGPYYLDGVAFCEEHDLGTYLCCLQGVRTATLDRLGQWDEAVALSGIVLRRVLASPVNRMIPIGTLGRIRARRRSRVPGSTWMKPWPPRTAPASPNTSCPRGWAGPRHAGSRGNWRPPATKPSWPTRRPIAPTPGCAVRPPPGCAAPDQTASRGAGSPSRTGWSSTATGGARPSYGTRSAAPTTPRSPCSMQPRNPPCAGPWTPARTLALSPRPALSGARCASWASARSRSAGTPPPATIPSA